MKRTICPPQICGSAWLLVLVMLLSSTLGLGQTGSRNTEAPAAAHMRALNNSLLSLHGQMQQAGPNNVRLLRSQAATVIAQRAAALTKLIQNDPHAALSFAFSPELLADLAAKFPQSSSLLESHTTVTGPVQRWTADYARSSRSWWTMNAGGRSLNLYFAGQEPATLKSDQLLQATGVVAGSEMAVETNILVQSSTASNSTPNSSRLLAAKKPPQGQQWPTFALLMGGLAFSLPGLRGKIRLTRERMLAFRKQFASYALVFAFVFASTPMYAQNACTTTGMQSTIVILATFPGVAPPSTQTPQSVSDMFFGAAAPSVTNYLQETSYGTTSATGDVFGWYTLTGTYSCQYLSQLQSDAMSAAAAAGANFQNYNHVVVIFPDTIGCGWSGLSSIGCGSLNTPSGAIQASSEYVAAADATVQVASHELGHGLGLHHASTRAFTDSSGTPIILGPLGATGTLTEYGSPFSTMGNCAIYGCPGGEYDAPQKAEILDWLGPNTGYQTVQSGGTYMLQPYEVPGGLKAIKVQRGTGNNAWLWLEYRQPDGNYDTTLTFPSPLWTTLLPQPYSGALIHYEDSTTGIHTHLINYTPSDSSFYSPALVAGQSWSDPYSNVSLSVVSATSTGLAVNVSYGSVPCTPASPTVAVSPLDPSIYPGNNVSYSVSITNNDSSGCSSNTYTLGSTQPTNWPTSFSATSVTLSPGQSASATMYKTGPSGTPLGTYAVNASASNGSYVGAGTANVTVMAAPSMTVTVSVPSTSYTRKSTVPITAAVLNGGTPVSGANITFTLTTASGTVTQSATTGSNGTATWSYRLSPKSSIGTYSVSAQASYTPSGATSTQTATSNTVTFTVQ